MELLTHYKRIKYIDWLIGHKATGRPVNLANKLKLSEITIYRYIRMMKGLGAPIKYCRKCNSYIYTEENYTIQKEIK